MWLICPDAPQVSRLQRTKAQNMSLLAAERLAPSLGSSHQTQHHCLHLSGGECPPSPLTTSPCPSPLLCVCVCVCVIYSNDHYHHQVQANHTDTLRTLLSRVAFTSLSFSCSCMLNDTHTDKHGTLTHQSPVLISLLLSPSLICFILAVATVTDPVVGETAPPPIFAVLRQVNKQAISSTNFKEQLRR